MLYLRHMNPQTAKAGSGENPKNLCAIPPSPTGSRALVHLFRVRAEQAPSPKLNEHLHDCDEQVGVVQDPPRRGVAGSVSQHTVVDVPGDITFTDHRQIGVLQHRLGRIGAAALAAEPAPVNRPELTLVHARVEQPLRFPGGAETRKIDVSNRIKLHLADGPLQEVLGWELGALDAVTIDGWLVLTQPTGFAGVRRDRCGPHARFTAPGGDRERITFRPAQFDCLHTSKGRHRLSWSSGRGTRPLK